MKEYEAKFFDEEENEVAVFIPVFKANSLKEALDIVESNLVLLRYQGKYNAHKVVYIEVYNEEYIRNSNTFRRERKETIHMRRKVFQNDKN